MPRAARCACCRRRATGSNWWASTGLSARVREAERVVDSHCGCCGQAADEAARRLGSSDLSRCASRTCGEYFGDGCRRVMAVPLMHRNRVLGVYNLFFASDDEPSADTAALLRSIGELLGLALDNLRLEAENLRATVMHERQAMAAEIHDAVAQNLTFVDMRLPLLRDAIVAQDPERALKYLDDVRETLGEAHGSLRQIVTQFRTRMDPLGLGRALGALSARFSVRTGIELKVANGMPGLRLAEDEELEIFHIVQEALANIERHSRARRAWLSVEPTLAGVVVRVEDDGVGPQPDEARAARRRPLRHGHHVRARAAPGWRSHGRRRAPRAARRSGWRCRSARPAELRSERTHRSRSSWWTTTRSAATGSRTCCSSAAR